MNDKEMKELELRLERIEKAVETIATQRSGLGSLSAEEINVYHKVRSALWEEGSCGINETSPCIISCRVIDKICKVVPIPICRACDVECTCGPCNVYLDLDQLRGGSNRFRGLGR